MGTNPKISIITVVYNGIAEIENTILSVINQTYTHFQYIIIDGGSIDGTVEVIRKYEKNIDYWISERDKGIYDAMNKGIQIANGDWIHFRNCGDYFFSKNTLFEIFNNSNFDNKAIIHGNCRIWDQYGFCDKVPSIIENASTSLMPVFHPGTFIPLEIHKSINFDCSYKLSADFDFILKCIKINYNFTYINNTIALFNIGNGASIDNIERSMREDYKIIGGNQFSLYKKISFFYTMKKYKIMTILKKSMPISYMYNRRLKQGWTLWTANLTPEIMINNCIEK